MSAIYLDYGSTTPLDPRVLDAMLPYLKEDFGNPLSLHQFGDKPREAMEKAREQVAALIGARAQEIYFTATGSEANNFALKGIAVAHRQRGNHLVISTIEHASVMNSAKTLEKLGFEVSTVPVDKWGLVDPAAVKETLRDDTILVSVMHANPEIGTIEPIADIARAAHERDILFHTDAAMSAGTIPVDVGEMEIDLLSLVGHQFYGPNGGAALFVRKGVRIMPFIDGGIQERGRRAGTENIPAIVGLGTAAELAQAVMKARAERLSPLRDRLMIGLEESIPHTIVTGHRTRRLPGHVSACFEYVEGEGMMLHLDMMGIAVSSGSTCTSKALKASHVLSAIGIPAATANGSLIITMGEQTVPEDVDAVLEKLPPIVERLRKMSPLYKEI